MSELTPEELDEITRATVGHYNENAGPFWTGTRDHDVSQNMDALSAAIEGDGPWRLLDFGCGPGRDLMAWKQRGHAPVGLDGAAQFCEMARENSGCEVLHQDFLALDLPAASFHGVFANATLFHIPRQELPRVLTDLHAALSPRGVLFSSNPRGSNVEGWNGSRFGSYHDLAAWTALVTAAGFEPIDHYYRPPGRPRDQQPWLASTWRKP